MSGASTPTLAVTGTSSITGSNTGDQTITLTSDVTGSGTGSFATTIKSSVTLTGSPTTTTQTAADNSTKIATTAYVENAILQGSFVAGAGISITGKSIALTAPVTVALGGTNATSAGITAFNNITGYTASGATGTTSTSLVFSTSPVLTTPTLGVATATSINKVAITAPATSATLTIADGKTLTASKTMTLTSAGDSAIITFPNATDTVAGLAAVQTITGAWTYNDGKLILAGATSGTTTLKATAVAGATTATLPATSGTLVNTTSVIDIIYPIGSIYTSTSSTNPGTTFGVGTWAAYAAGRVLVGVGTSDQAFAAAATGGESNHTLSAAESGAPAHTHLGLGDGNLVTGGAGGDAAALAQTGTAFRVFSGTAANTAAAASSAHNNLQPYVVVYMWQRTA